MSLSYHLIAREFIPCSHMSSDPTSSGPLEERLGKAKSSNSLHPSPQGFILGLVIKYPGTLKRDEPRTQNRL